ncbi:MAG: aminotransferase class V-fold PLP-dependent enzyme, partial [Longimicrobiales bacterium]
AGAGGRAGAGGGSRQGRRARLERTFAALHERGEALFARLWERLESVEGVTLYGPPPGAARTPTLVFDVAGIEPGDVAANLSARGVFVSHGDFYAPDVLERFGRADRGLVRAGCACYTSEAEVDRLMGGVAEIAAGGR